MYNFLAANTNIVWCICGAIYELDCGARNGQKHVFKCLRCKKRMCAGCGDVAKKKHTCNIMKIKDSVNCPKCKARISRIQGAVVITFF